MPVTTDAALAEQPRRQPAATLDPEDAVVAIPYAGTVAITLPADNKDRHLEVGVRGPADFEVAFFVAGRRHLSWAVSWRGTHDWRRGAP